MFLKIAYWSSTVIVAVALLGALSYLTGSEQVVSGFTRSGSPQHLRIVLGIAKRRLGFALRDWQSAGPIKVPRPPVPATPTFGMPAAWLSP